MWASAQQPPPPAPGGLGGRRRGHLAREDRRGRLGRHPVRQSAHAAAGRGHPVGERIAGYVPDTMGIRCDHVCETVVLQSQRGVKGGYSFARQPSEVTVLEVVELLEGSWAGELASIGEAPQARMPLTRRARGRIEGAHLS